MEGTALGSSTIQVELSVPPLSSLETLGSKVMSEELQSAVELMKHNPPDSTAMMSATPEKQSPLAVVSKMSLTSVPSPVCCCHVLTVFGMVLLLCERIPLCLV